MNNPFATETVTFATPVAMMTACHDRVRHYAALTAKLVPHMAASGVDAAAIAAAQSILRYFDVAAPLHHQDEDDDLFPAMLTKATPELAEAIHTITAEHAELAALWQHVRTALLAIVAGDASLLNEALATEFAHRYPAHAAREERDIYPFATALLDAETLHSLGKIMAQRRGATNDEL